MKKFFCFALLLILVFTTVPAFAAYPDKPITNIVPASPGGGYDGSSRIVTEEWGRILGYPFKFDYKPGASSMIGMRLVALDDTGYTTGVTTLGMVNIVNKLQKDAPASWENMAFVGNILTDPDAIFVHKDSKFKTLNDLIEYGKKNTLKVGTAHPSAVSSLAARVFIEETGIKATVVSFNGGADSRKALAGKHVDMIVSVAAPAVKMKEFFHGLVIFADKNYAKGIYDMPTMKEAMPDKEFPIFVEPYPMCVSRKFAKDHPEDYAKLVKTMKQAMSSEAAATQAKSSGYTPFVDYWTPEQCEKYAADFDKTLDKYSHLLMQK